MWERTALWRRLVETTSAEDPLRAQLARALPAIEALLAQAGTAPRAFTLHDADHSRRVAERMAAIVPDATWKRLSPNELALLLLSAYLHDIGMTPAHGRVAAYHSLLVDGSDGVLDSAERAAFQAWLDRTRPGTEIAAGSRVVTTAELRRIDALTAHWVRDRHVDWSEAWIRAHLRFEVPAHPTFDEDLIALCRSHHDGQDVLLAERFDPRFAGASAVHLRYLAAVLRVADVLEVDPERTPPIVFRHRDVDGPSAIHWHKDHELAITLERGGRVIAEASPRSATMHRAVEETVDPIEHELRLVQSLAAERPFGFAPLRRSPLPHEWQIEPLVYRRIQPKDGAYEYVDGGFRPNTEKLLELLGGTALYRSPLNGVRELLQNAFDAVRERIGWQRLAHADHQALLEALVQRHEVVLELISDADGTLWLACSDTGAGMTKEIITERVLVSGSGPSPELLQLRRDLHARGLPFERTGRFGIGVLSYFMLGERVEIETRRCDEARSRDGAGWAFSTEGVGSFGELRRLEREHPGTRVAIRLDGLADLEPEAVWDAIEDYVEWTLVRLPCTLRLVAQRLGRERRLPAGWVDDREEVLRGAWLGGRSVVMTPRVHRRLRWLELEEELPGGLGRFLARLPYLETPYGLSLLPVDVEARGSAKRGVLVRAYGSAPDWTRTGESWHGMRLGIVARRDQRERTYVKIDWQTDAAGSLSVDRTSLTVSNSAKDALEHVHRRVGEALADLVAQHRRGLFTPANVRVLPDPGLFDEAFDDDSWMVYEPARAERAGTRWRRLDGALLQREGDNMLFRPCVVSVGGEPVTCLVTLFARGAVDWGVGQWPPDRLVIDREVQQLALLWHGPRPGPATLDGVDPAVELPPELGHLVAVVSQRLHTFNVAHPLVRAANAVPGMWRAQCERHGADQLDRGHVLSCPAAAAAWLLWFVRAARQDRDFFSDRPDGDEDDLWSHMCVHEPDFVAKAWRLAWSEHAGAVAPLLDLNIDDDDRNVFTGWTYSLAGLGWGEVIPYQLLVEHCANASDDWLVSEHW